MESVAASLAAISGTRILVVGDVMLDRYWTGGVSRISPEAPVPVVNVAGIEERVGGAGNVALNICSLGGRCTLGAVAGDDSSGDSVRAMLSERGVELSMQQEAGLETTVKLRIVSRNQQLLRADFESVPDAGTLDQLAASLEDQVANHDLVVFSDYGKGVLSRISEWITVATAAGKPVLVDPKGDDFDRYRGATLVTPNLAEFEQVSGKVSDHDDLVAKASRLCERYDFQSILVTLSDKGMTLVDRTAGSTHVDARAREVYDVSGAGDTVIGVMAMGMAADLPTTACLELANSAAGVVISKLGTATVTAAELGDALNRDYSA